MSRSLFHLFSRRNLENPNIPISSSRLLDLFGATTTDAGVVVNEETSLRMSAVYRATSLISALGGSLPLHVYDDETHERVSNALLDDPHPDLTKLELWRGTYVHRCLWGNAYLQKIRDGANRVRYLYPISPWRVQVGKARRPIPTNPTGKIFYVTNDDGQKVELTPNEILHIPGLMYDGVCGISPVRAAAQAIGVSLAAEKSAAKLFGSGNMLSGILQTEQRLTQEQAELLQERWRSKFAGADRAHSVAVLDSGAQFQSMTMPSADAQMLESRDFSVTEMARYFGVPPYLMFQTERSTSWGTGLEQQATGFVKFDLHPQWLAPTEQRVTKELLPSDRSAKYALEGLLRGDTMARAEFYRVMREVGAFSANDIRELEDMPAIDGGDTYLQPLNMAPLGSEGVDAAPPPTPAPPAGGGSGGGSGGGKKPKKTGPKDGDGDGIAPEV